MPRRIALALVLFAAACRPRQAAPAEAQLASTPEPSTTSYTDEDGTFHIVESADQIPARYRPAPWRDARLWAAGNEPAVRRISSIAANQAR